MKSRLYEMPSDGLGPRWSHLAGKLVLVEGCDAVAFFAPELESLGARRVTGEERHQSMRHVSEHLTDMDV